MCLDSTILNDKWIRIINQKAKTPKCTILDVRFPKAGISSLPSIPSLLPLNHNKKPIKTQIHFCPNIHILLLK